MQIIKWKASNVGINKSKDRYQMRGMLVAECDNCVEYKIPYGAEDVDYSIAYEKCISEMCERATWFNLYVKYPWLFANTVGFSAHPCFENARINSKREYIEHELISLLLNLFSKGWVHVLDFFSVFLRNEMMGFHYSSKVTEYVIVFRYCILVNGKIGLAMGMGKDDLIEDAFIHALDESYLVENALNNYIKRGTKKRSDSLVDEEIEFFYGVFNNLELFDFFCKIDCDYQTQSRKIVFFCYDVIDLSAYLPNFLKKYNRRITYCSDLDSILKIKKEL